VAESRRVEVADTVGAGDSFMAALVAATLPDRCAGVWTEGPTHSQVAEYLSAAHVAAAVTVTRRGADPPRLGELPPGWPRV
jgi:fructokinase